MSTTLLEELIDTRTNLMPWTVDQYHRMIAEGIIEEGEPFELLNGYVVRKNRSAIGEDPMTVGLDHAWSVKKLAALSRKLEHMGCHIQTQQPITLEPSNEPEPDAAIVLGKMEDYHDQHPGPEDVLCVIEVADASLRRDRTTKLRIYAAGGIKNYVIVNLPDRCIEVYTRPTGGKRRYGQPLILAPRQSVSFPVAGGKSLTVPVRQLLP